MSTNQTKKSKYPSKYSDKFITFAQYLAEIMCERRAVDLNVDLPRFFWSSSKEWRQYFLYQVRLANELSKEYSPALLIRVVNEVKVYSLKVKRLRARLEEMKNETPLPVEEVVQPPQENSHPSGVFIRKKGLLGKLDE